MYVDIHSYTYICTYTYIHLYMYVHTPINIHTHTYMYTYIYISKPTAVQRSQSTATVVWLRLGLPFWRPEFIQALRSQILSCATVPRKASVLMSEVLFRTEADVVSLHELLDKLHLCGR